MIAILSAVCACLFDNGTLPSVLDLAEYGVKSLSKGDTHTLSGRPGYFVLYSLYSEEKTIFTVDGDRYNNPSHVYQVALSGNDNPVHVTLEADAKLAYMEIPLRITCHQITILGLHGVPETFSYVLGHSSLDGYLCFMPVTYSETETLTVSVKTKAPFIYTQVFDSSGQSWPPCEESECEFPSLRLGNLIFTAMSRYGSSLEVKKHGPAQFGTDDPCVLPNGYGPRDWPLSLDETSLGYEFFISNSFTCSWKPWWLFLSYAVVIIIVVGSIFGGIMCCYCGVCTCCGCCTCWAAKEITRMGYTITP